MKQSFGQNIHNRRNNNINYSNQSYNSNGYYNRNYNNNYYRNNYYYNNRNYVHNYNQNFNNRIHNNKKNQNKLKNYSNFRKNRRKRKVRKLKKVVNLKNLSFHWPSKKVIKARFKEILPKKYSTYALLLCALVAIVIGYSMASNNISSHAAKQERIIVDDRMAKHPNLSAKVSAVKPQKHNFINTFAELAGHQSEYHVTPSIVIAQAALESNWGNSDLFKKANNPFGVKGVYHGQSSNYGTQEYTHGKAVDSMAQFKKYPDLDTAVKDHNKLLKQQFLKGSDPDDCVSEALALQKNHYATDPHYAYEILQYIQKNNLIRFD